MSLHESLAVRDSSRASSAIAISFERLAAIAFFVTIVLIPVRLRIDLSSRPSIPVYSDYTDLLLFAPEIAMLSTLVFWLLSLLLAPRPIRLGPAYLWLPLAGLSLAGLASVAGSVDRTLSLYHALRLGVLFLFFLYVLNEVTAASLVVAAIAFQGILQAIVAIAQFVAQSSIGLQALGEYLLNPSWNGISIVSTGSARILRAYGLSDHPNILGGCLAFGMILLLAAYLSAGWERRLILLIPFLPMSLALLLTFSRAAWLAFVVGAVFLVGIEIAFRRWASVQGILWLILASAITLAPFVWNEASLLGIRLGAHGSLSAIPSEEQSVGERVLLMRAANHIFAAHPLTGIGLGASPIALKNEYPKLNTDYQPPHLALLEAAEETGLVGGLCYFLLVVLPWVFLVRHREMLAQPLVAGAAALLLVITVVGFFDYYTWLLIPGRLWQWLSWGFLAAAVQRAN